MCRSSATLSKLVAETRDDQVIDLTRANQASSQLRIHDGGPTGATVNSQRTAPRHDAEAQLLTHRDAQCTPRALLKAANFCVKTVVEGALPETHKPLWYGSMWGMVPEWHARFIAVPLDLLYEIVAAANGLELTHLADLSCAQVASMMRDKPPDEIRHVLKVVHDFTPAELVWVREQNAWCVGPNNDNSSTSGSPLPAPARPSWYTRQETKARVAAEAATVAMAAARSAATAARAATAAAAAAAGRGGGHGGGGGSGGGDGCGGGGHDEGRGGDHGGSGEHDTDDDGNGRHGGGSRAGDSGGDCSGGDERCGGDDEGGGGASGTGGTLRREGPRDANKGRHDTELDMVIIHTALLLGWALGVQHNAKHPRHNRSAHGHAGRQAPQADDSARGGYSGSRGPQITNKVIGGMHGPGTPSSDSNEAEW